MPSAKNRVKYSADAGKAALKICVVLIFLALVVSSFSRHAAMQNPVFNSKIDIDQDKLIAGGYPLTQVLQAGGQFWTTPYTKYDAHTKMGDGYGEGPDGPRAWQRQLFNKNTPDYTFLRLNGLDSQSCYECHNSIGSDPGYGAGSPLIRKQPSSVGGSAGFNSTAFINPCFPYPLTLFIRSPPHVYGSGYVQTVGDDITYELYKLRKTVRTLAKNDPNKPHTIALVDKVQGLDFGFFTTTYTGKGTWMQTGKNKSACPQPPPTCRTCLPGCDKPPPVAKPSALAGKFSAQQASARATAVRGAKLTVVSDNTDLGTIMVDGFTDDTSKVTGVSFDLIVRPFQWKGVASSIRHFVRDALDFHLSMQAVEKVGAMDCDMDDKTEEVSVGNVSAMAAFVGMTRPPQQMVPPGVSNDSVSRGYAIFTGQIPGLPPKAQQMCATCHVPTLPLTSPDPQFHVDTAVSYPGTDCPTEATGSYTSLIAPLRNHTLLPVVKRIKARSATTAVGAALSYTIPLNSTDVPAADLPRLAQTGAQKSLFFLPFLLPQPPADTFNVPLFSDLRTHDMGTLLADPTAQSSDVMGVCIQPSFFLTRPLWGVADTGPWLHDGRATSLLEAILMHGDSKTGSEAAPIVEAFNGLSDDDKQNVVNFLLSLRLPVERP